MLHKFTTAVAAAALIAGASLAQDQLDLNTSIEIAINSNPEIDQAIQNREAIEFELEQARGLYRPRVLFEASAGVRELDSPQRRATGRANDTLEPLEASLIAEQVVFDGYDRRGELNQQAARVDGADHRVFERSEFIGLEVAREYLNVGLQDRLVDLAEENVDFHQAIVDRMQEGFEGEATSGTDLRQSQERLAAAQRRLTEARRERNIADITFRRIVGLPTSGYVQPRSVRAALPSSIDMALGRARSSNPEVWIAQSGVSAAEGEYLSARAGYLPRVLIEGRLRSGQDIDAFEGRTDDVQVRAVVRWTLWDSGISRANEQEQLRRVSEERFRLHQTYREVEENVRLSWNRLERERELVETLRQQASFADEVVPGYDQQFNAGQRSLLDLLDAQNTRISVREALYTSEHSLIFAEYRMLASMGVLLETLGIAPNDYDGGTRQAEYGVAPIDAGETESRREP